MKTIFYLSIILFSINLKAQQIYDISEIDYTVEDGRYYKDLYSKLDPFIGIWKNTTGNTTFKVILWKKEKESFNGYYVDLIVGDYEMIENEGQPNENIIYKSKKLININNPQYFTPAIRVRGGYPGVAGTVFDNIHFSNTENYLITGRLDFVIDPSTGKAHWKVKDRREMKGIGEPDMTIPKDIILTKQ